MERHPRHELRDVAAAVVTGVPSAILGHQHDRHSGERTAEIADGAIRLHSAVQDVIFDEDDREYGILADSRAFDCMELVLVRFLAFRRERIVAVRPTFRELGIAALNAQIGTLIAGSLATAGDCLAYCRN